MLLIEIKPVDIGGFGQMSLEYHLSIGTVKRIA